MLSSETGETSVRAEFESTLTTCEEMPCLEWLGGKP